MTYSVNPLLALSLMSSRCDFASKRGSDPIGTVAHPPSVLIDRATLRLTVDTLFISLDLIRADPFHLFHCDHPEFGVGKTVPHNRFNAAGKYIDSANHQHVVAATDNSAIEPNENTRFRWSRKALTLSPVR